MKKRVSIFMTIAGFVILLGGLLTYGIPNMKLPKSVVQRRIDLMTDEGVSFVTGVDASDPAEAKRLLHSYDAVILCCGAGRPRPLSLDTKGVNGVCCGTDYLKAAVQRHCLQEDAALPAAEGLDVVIVGTGDTASDCVACSVGGRRLAFQRKLLDFAQCGRRNRYGDIGIDSRGRDARRRGQYNSHNQTDRRLMTLKRRRLLTVIPTGNLIKRK